MTDNGKGALEVTELTYDGKTELPVFTNTYVKPVEPPKDDSGLMQTGDSTSTSERMGCCVRSLDRALTRLRREGLVVSTPVFNKVGGSWATSIRQRPKASSGHNGSLGEVRRSNASPRT